MIDVVVVGGGHNGLVAAAYLVSLLPQRIIDDLGLRVRLRRRQARGVFGPRTTGSCCAERGRSEGAG